MFSVNIKGMKNPSEINKFKEDENKEYIIFFRNIINGISKNEAYSIINSALREYRYIISKDIYEDNVCKSNNKSSISIDESYLIEMIGYILGFELFNDYKIYLIKLLLEDKKFSYSTKKIFCNKLKFLLEEKNILNKMKEESYENIINTIRLDHQKTIKNLFNSNLAYEIKFYLLKSLLKDEEFSNEMKEEFSRIAEYLLMYPKYIGHKQYESFDLVIENINIFQTLIKEHYPDIVGFLLIQKDSTYEQLCLFKKIIKNESIFPNFIQIGLPEIIKDIFSKSINTYSGFYQIYLFIEIIENVNIFSNFIKTDLLNITRNLFQNEFNQISLDIELILLKIIKDKFQVIEKNNYEQLNIKGELLEIQKIVEQKINEVESKIKEDESKINKDESKIKEDESRV